MFIVGYGNLCLIFKEKEMREINKRLSRIQRELKAPKSNENKFGGYKYRSCEDILEALKPLLQDGETFTISDKIVAIGGSSPSKSLSEGVTDKGNPFVNKHEFGERFYVEATATFHFGGETISVTAYARESFDKKGMDASQITGSTSSYARKYALNGLLLIDDTKDADATNDHGNEEKRFTKEDKKNWKSIQSSISNKMALCKSLEELDNVMFDYSEHIKEMPDSYSDFLNDKYFSIKDSGFKFEQKVNIASVTDAIMCAKEWKERLNGIETTEDLQKFEDEVVNPYLIGKDGNVCELDRVLHAERYINEGKTPADRLKELFKAKIAEIGAK